MAQTCDAQRRRGAAGRKRLLLALLTLVGPANAVPGFHIDPACLDAVHMAAINGTLKPYTEAQTPGRRCDKKLPEKLTLFWTIGPGRYHRRIVLEQAKIISDSGLARAIDHVFVNSFDHDRGNNATPWRDHFELAPTDDLPPDIKVALGSLAPKVGPVRISKESTAMYTETLVPSFEFPALEGLWDYCRREPDALVAYFHTKGSGKASQFLSGKDARNADGSRVRWRGILNTFVLERWRECIEAIGCGFDTCGPLLQYRHRRVYWPHYSGNFWWASCRYVNTRTSPRPTLQELKGVGFEGTRPLGRYLAEAWILGQQAPATPMSTFHYYSPYGTPDPFVKARDADAPRSSSFTCKLPPPRTQSTDGSDER